MQQEVHAQVVNGLQTATAEQDIAKRVQLLQQTSDLVLRADTQAETVGNCLDYFLKLKADPLASLRRYVAHFLERLLVFKPSLALRCQSAIAVLLADSDDVVRELAARAAVALHGRALLLISLEQETSQHRQLEQLHGVQEVMKGLLLGGCAKEVSLFHLAVRWAKVVILTQTPSPLLVRVRIPAELRGVSCLQDFPESPHMDLNALRQQADELFGHLCRLLEKPPAGAWSRPHFRVLLQGVTSVIRQRPMFVRAALDVWGRLMQQAAAALEGQAQKADMPVAVADAPYLRNQIWSQCQCLLASSVAAEHHGDVIELQRAAGLSGSLEDVLTQAKYQQICTMVDSADGVKEPPAKRARTEMKRVWAGRGNDVLGDEDAFDADALLSGEAEVMCRRFEDYFGLPSQREPAGHVAGPALLASRVGSHAELARIALTSLNSLSMKRSLLRDRASERAVAFSDPLVLDPAKAKDAKGDAPELSLFLSAERIAAEEEEAADPAAVAKDPRGALRGGLPATRQKDGAVDQLLAPEGPAAQLPPDIASREALQLRLFQEVLEAQKRMERSLLKDALSPTQLAHFDVVSRQVALHLAAATKVATSATLQRAMCKAYALHAFDLLKTSLEASKGAATQGAAAPAAGSVALGLGKLVELFYAKFTTDVARWQEVSASPAARTSAAVAAATTPLREVLEGVRPAERRILFTYGELFEIFLAEFEKRQLPRRELRTFLNEIPWVPLSAFRMLEAQCLQASSRKMALLTVLSLVENKPSCRWHALHLLFKLAYFGGDDSGVRFDTIRLIINKIYSPGPHKPMRWQLPHLSDAEAAPLLEGGGLSWALGEDEFVPLQRLKGRCVEDVATMMLRSIALATAKFAFPVKVPARIEQVRDELFKGAVCPPKDRVWLYLALCIKRPVLLHELVESFTTCDDDMKEHLINSIEEAIKYIPASEREVLVLVQKASPETERLVLKVLHILIQTSQGKESLSAEYGEAVTRLYGVTQNPRLLVPVFDLLDRKHLLDFLPAVMQLETEQVTDAFRQLIRSPNPPLSVTELLTELHHMNNPSENIVPVKASMQALNIVFGMRDHFDAKVYGIVIQSLVEEQGPLPTLFMRTVIQVVKELPRLSDFVVMEILPRLVRQEVWADANLWRGFMIVLQHTFASQPGGAARVLAMLPTSQLEDVLVQHPDWKAQLREFVARQPAGMVAPHVQQLLQ